MKLIPLSQNKFAVIDDEDYALVTKYRWHFSKVSKEYGRAKASLGRRGRAISMHRLIMGNPVGLDVDHINGDTLDNRRCNLRIVTHAQNQKEYEKTQR